MVSGKLENGAELELTIMSYLLGFRFKVVSKEWASGSECLQIWIPGQIHGQRRT